MGCVSLLCVVVVVESVVPFGIDKYMLTGSAGIGDGDWLVTPIVRQQINNGKRETVMYIVVRAAAKLFPARFGTRWMLDRFVRNLSQ